MRLPGLDRDQEAPETARFGPLDDDLTAAHQRVEQAQQALEDARDQRARRLIEAHAKGYSIYALGKLTGGRKAPSVHRDLRRFTEPGVS